MLVLPRTASYTFLRGHMRDLLVYWGVRVDQSLFQFLDNCVTLVDSPQTEEKTELLPCLLVFKTDVSVLQSKDLHDRISSWLVPIMDNRDLLFYFSAHESVLFQAYLETELEKLTETFSHHRTSMMTSVGVQSETPRAMWSSFFGFATDSADESNQSCSESLSLETFNEGLVKTHQCLKQLLDLTAVFQHVSVIGQDRFKGVNVEAEFTTVVKYPDFRDYNVETVHRSIGDMLALVQYSSVIKVLILLCSKFNTAVYSCRQLSVHVASSK